MPSERAVRHGGGTDLVLPGTKATALPPSINDRAVQNFGTSNQVPITSRIHLESSLLPMSSTVTLHRESGTSCHKITLN